MRTRINPYRMVRQKQITLIRHEAHKLAHDNHRSTLYQSRQISNLWDSGKSFRKQRHLMTEPKTEAPRSNLRIASLLPAATDICSDLGLDDYVVGVTHECDSLFVGATIILTASGLAEHMGQGDIHKAVQEAVDINSLYPILKDKWDEANPNLVLTQDLCAVCGPSSRDVCVLNPTIQTVSLSPNTLAEVAESFVQVAEACGVKAKGLALQDSFLTEMNQIQSVVNRLQHTAAQRPKILLLEWIDPPFDGGHWIPEMIQLAGCDNAKLKSETKSKILPWSDIVAAKPDVIVVACCGFDLTRNIKDAKAYWVPHLEKMVQQGCRIYAADGNQYFARPGPKLRGGVSILAQCAYETDGEILKEIQAFEFSPKRGQAWDRVFGDATKDTIGDMEDMVGTFSKLHDEACARGEWQYVDPVSGFQVFTELAHKKRGKCCGSGCRHCPYSHENVKDKAEKIQQPAFLFQSTTCSNNDMSVPIKVLFFSGGKDSFLALRALMRNPEPALVILLTTFDAISRVVAHQEVHIQEVQRQAQHLEISHLGIPLNRAGGENYVDRLSRGLRVIEDVYKRPITTLVFGDLHLEHIRGWRETELGRLGYHMEYPLWQVPYGDLLEDLEASKVPCIINASTVDEVEIGTLFTRTFYSKLIHEGIIDGFGEKGEFHSLAKVWETDRKTALGLLQ